MSFIAGEVEKGKIFLHILGIEKNHYTSFGRVGKSNSCTFDTPVPCNSQREGRNGESQTSCDLVYTWETDYPGEYVTARDF